MATYIRDFCEMRWFFFQQKLAAIAPVFFLTLLACGQSATSQPNRSSEPRAIAQATTTDDSCIAMFAYDPEDTTVNFRDAPDGNIIARLPNLTRLQPTAGPAGADAGWNHVYIMETQELGYVWGDVIYRTAYRVQDPNDTGANLHQTPGGDIVATIPNGTTVNFLGSTRDWMHVSLPVNEAYKTGQDGYIAASLLTGPACN